jgi:hypothetical protein
MLSSCFAALFLCGCSILFDSSSQDGVQIVKSASQAIDSPPDGVQIVNSAGQAISERESTSAISQPTVLDLRSSPSPGQGGANGGGDRSISLTSRDAVRELRDRRSLAPAEKKLIRAIALFDREETSQARRIIDQSLIDNLTLAADRAVAHMYRGFMLCYEQDKSACAFQFRRMYAEVPGFVVTEEEQGYRRWSPVLDEVTAEYRGSSTAAANAPTASSHRRSTLQISSIADGGSQLLLNVRPGGSITFDGKLVGESPPIRIIKVNPGVHSLVLSGRGEPFAADIDVGAGEQIEIRRDVR